MPDTHAPPGAGGPGICVSCGCSEANPCHGGCAWTDETKSLCTGCVVRAAEIRVGVALATLQSELYQLERAVLADSTDPENSEDGGGAFNEAFGDVARIFGRLSGVMAELLETEQGKALADRCPICGESWSDHRAGECPPAPRIVKP